jgi:Holliday junction DNA helicase RuvA
VQVNTSVGPHNRKALRALAIDPAAVARAIVGKDASALQQLPEIGKRLAETIIAELSGKVESYLSPAEVEHLERGAGKGAGAPAEGPASEAIDTLVALGETRSNAEFLVGRAADRAGRAGRSSPSAAELVELVYAAGR